MMAVGNVLIVARNILFLEAIASLEAINSLTHSVSHSVIHVFAKSHGNLINSDEYIMELSWNSHGNLMEISW